MQTGAPEMLRMENLLRQKARLARLCVDAKYEAKPEADGLLRGSHGEELLNMLLADVSLLSKAVTLRFDIAQSRGGKSRLLMDLIKDAKRTSLAQAVNLLEAGWYVDEATDTGKTALMWAASSWNAPARHRVDLLMRYGADPMFKDADGKSAFDYAPIAMCDYLRMLHQNRIEAEQAERRQTAERRASA